jgi:MFS family permease
VNPALRRKLVLLFLMSLSTVVGFWAVSTWIPQYASQLAAAAGREGRQWGTVAGLLASVGAIAGYLVFGWLADTWGHKPSTWLYFLGSLPAVWVPFLLIHDPVLFLVAAAANGFFTTGLFAWMPIYLPELFPTAVRGSAISLVFNSTRYVAALGPLAAGWAITTFGGIASAASIIALVYVIGLVVTPFAAPETKGKPLPS